MVEPTSRDRPPVSVQLLGGFALRSDSEAMPALPPQAASLLAYLIVHRDRPQTRDLIGGRLWPNVGDQAARKRLSNALWLVKAGTELAAPGLIVATTATIQLSQDYEITVDSERFESDVSELSAELRDRRTPGQLLGQLTELVESYPGEFLAGFYDDWIESTRLRIADRYRSSLALLVRLFRGRSDYDSALRFARLLVAQDPLHEESHREVMWIHAVLGNVSAAERQFDACRQALQEELGVGPSPETAALIEKIRSERPTATPDVLVDTPGQRLPIIGRHRERSELVRRADDLNTGLGGTVLIEGEPGIGKSKLIEDFTDSAEWRKIRVLTARHSQLSNLEPYEGLKEALNSVVTGLKGEHLAEVLEPIWLQLAASVLTPLQQYCAGNSPSRSVRPDEEASRTSEALAQVVLAQGDLGPTVIVLEDVHWCDTDSLKVIAQLGARLERAGVLICMTYRRTEAELMPAVWSSIAAIESQPSTNRLSLGPLSVTEVGEMIEAELGPGVLATSVVSRLVQRTNGNPLFILESLRDPVIQAASQTEGTLTPLETDLPPSLIETLRLRLENLEWPTVQVLQAVAAISEPCSAPLVSTVVERPRAEVLKALTDGVRIGLLVEENAGICRFSHEHNRQVVYDLVPTDDRFRIHDRVYEASIAATEGSAGHLAYHARLAGRWLDAYRWHASAADEAVDLNAFGTAVRNYRQADDAAQEAGLKMAELAPFLLRFEAILDVLGERTEQDIVLKRLSAVDLLPDLEMELAERRCWLLANSDEPAEASKLARESAVRAEELGLPQHRFWTVIGTASIWSGDSRGAIEPLSRVVESADDLRDRVAAENMIGRAYIDALEMAKAKSHLESALAGAIELDDVRSQVEALGHQGVLNWHRGSSSEAEKTFRQALDLSRSIGYRKGEASNLVNLATLQATLGRGGRALELFSSATEVFRAHDNRRGEAFVQLNLAELLFRLVGDDDQALAIAQSAAVYFRSVDNAHHETMALCVISGIEIRGGRHRIARRRLDDLLERSLELQNTMSEYIIRYELAGLDSKVGNREAALEHLDHMLRIADGPGMEPELPNLLAQHAVALVQLDRLDEAETMAKRAMSLNSVGTRDSHLSAWMCSKVHEALGNREESETQVELAYNRLGADLDGLPLELTRKAWTDIPEHVEIANDYERRFKRRLTLDLPSIDAPLGRALRPDDFVAVEWELSHPEDWADGSDLLRRHRRIVRLADQAVAQGAVARISDLASALEVSERTIKRDIASLRSDGREIKTRRAKA